jgi:hypothetical protein
VKKHTFQWILPGVIFILLAFWAGTAKSMALAFLGFLSFFVIGVALVIEGRRKAKGNGPKTEN